MASVVVSPKGVRRLIKGHPWVFASDLRPSPAAPAAPGAVEVLDEAGELIGRGLYNPRSKLALRLVTRGEARLDAGLFAARAEAAARYRERAAAGFEAFRVIHSEADGLSGLTVDRYGDYLVYQLHAAALAPFLPPVLEVLQRRYQPRGVLARNDAPVREKEGLPRVVEVAFGEVPERIPYREGEVTLFAAPYGGQKTGAFLDQRENHVYAGALAQGRALDAFSYHGGFALQLARRAEWVLAVDSSASALEHLGEAARHNGLGNLERRQGDAFAVLRELVRADERFDTIVLDPPAFAKGREQVPAALAGYKEINLQALRLLAPGGRLLSASCSYHVSDASFYATIQEAAADAGREVRVLARRSQAACHPELLSLPETHYLKLIALEVVGWESR